MNNRDPRALSQRLRCKVAFLLDADIEFARDLLMASHMLDDLRSTRLAVDAMLAEASAVARVMSCGQR